MKNKNDKIKIVFVVFLLYFVLSWIFEGGIYGTSGAYTTVGIIRMGFFDIVSVIYSAFYYRTVDLVFLFTIGGCYGVLTKTLMYRNLVNKVCKFIKGREEIAFAVITSIIAILASLSCNIIIFFALAPFIMTIFLRNNYNRITAFSAGFGGMFLGYLGLTFGTYNMDYINDTMALSVNDWIIQKWIILLIGLVIFNVISILYMKKNKKKDIDQTKFDMFAIEPVKAEELVISKKKKKKTIKSWPLVLVGIISFIVIILGYINWEDSFNVTIFNTIFTKMNENMSIADVPVIESILGANLTAFGTWTDLLSATFVLLVGIVIIGLISKVKLDDFLSNFGDGMKKMVRVCFIYGFATSIMFLISMFPWPLALVNTLLGSGNFNIIILLLVCIIATIFIGDGNLTGYLLASGLTAMFSSNLIETSILLRIGSALTIFAGPTGFLLLSGLTYANIPYKAWIKYIWKFVLIFSLIVLILLTIIIYV